jgi:hypothetical protein
MLYKHFFLWADPGGRKGLRSRSEAVRLLGLRARIPLRAWIFILVYLAYCAGSGLCDMLITRSEESFWLWECVCDLDTSKLRRPRLEMAVAPQGKNKNKNRHQTEQQ